MSKRSLFLIVLLVLIIAVFSILSYYFVEEQKSYVNIPPINAVPQDAPLIIESHDFGQLIESLLDNNKLWRELQAIETVKATNNKLLYLDSVIKAQPGINDILDDRSVIVSAHLAGKNTLEFLFVVNIFNLNNEQQAQTIIDKLTNGKQRSSKLYDKVNIQMVQTTANGNDMFYFAVADGFLLMSFSDILIEESVRQLKSGNSLLTNAELREISQTAGKNVDANIYVNYRNLPNLLALFAGQPYKNSILNFAPFADWSEFDVNIHDETIMLNGFTNSTKTAGNYVSVFADQQPQSATSTKVLPSDISAFLLCGFSDIKSYFDTYKEYLRSSNHLESYSSDLQAIDKKYGISTEAVFCEAEVQEVCLAFMDINRADINKGNCLIIKTKNTDNIKKAFNKIIDTQAQADGKTAEQYSSLYTAGGNDYRITQMPVKNLPAHLFGNMFAKVYADYYTFIDDYLIMGSSTKNISTFVQSYESGRTLNNDDSYRSFAASIESESNLYFYANISLSANLIASHITDALNVDFENNTRTFGKFQALSFQLKNENKLLYSNLFVKYNPKSTSKSRSVWACRLDTTINMKPVLFTNHYTQEKEIFVQDQNNKIYLVSNTGRILWEKQLTEKILGKVYEVDIFNNNKLQLLFATRGKLHVIDRLGNYVEGFPFLFPSPAAADICLLDYDNNRNYRIAVPAINRQVYIFDATGKELDGWVKPTLATTATVPVQYFRVKGKDYLTVSDDAQTYLFDRRGQKRLTIATPTYARSEFALEINHRGSPSVERLVARNKNNEVVYVYLNGTVKTKKMEGINSSFDFTSNDLSGDGINELITASGTRLNIYNNENLTLNRAFNSIIECTPAVYHFSADSVKIGIVERKSNRIHLINLKGVEHPGFPMEGNSEFTIGYLSPTVRKFSLVTGNEQGYLICYEVL